MHFTGDGQDGALGPDAHALIDRFEATVAEVAEATAAAVFREVPGYGRQAAGFGDDVIAFAADNFRAMAAAMRSGQTVAPAALAFVREPSTRRARLGLPLADFLHGFRVGTRVAWTWLAAGAGGAPSNAAALALVRPMIDYTNVAATYATEVYGEVEQQVRAQGEQRRAEVLTDLLGGRRPAPEVGGDALQAAGLTEHGPCIVLSAVAAGGSADGHGLRHAASALSRALVAPHAPLALVRGDEVVALLPAGTTDGAAIGAAMERVVGDLHEQGTALAAGVSTIVDGLDEVPAAYREAVEARGRATAGVPVCLSAMTAFDYLTMVGDATARRLVTPEVAAFVDADLATGGTLTATLLAYARADMNVKVAAERLFVHANTAHYRLTKIAERTDRDLRRLEDVIELLIAVKLAHAVRPPGP